MTTETAAIEFPPVPSRVAGIRIVNQGSRFDFGDRQRLTVGRTRSRDIRIRVDDDDRTVSQKHCVIDRLPDDRYCIRKWKAKNGIYVAPIGAYSEPVEVESAILTLGMCIYLGNYELVTIDEHGRCLIMGTRFSEILRGATLVYGSDHQAGEKLGLSRRVIRRWLDRLKGKREKRS